MKEYCEHCDLMVDDDFDDDFEEEYCIKCDKYIGILSSHPDPLSKASWCSNDHVWCKKCYRERENKLADKKLDEELTQAYNSFKATAGDELAAFKKVVKELLK